MGTKTDAGAPVHLTPIGRSPSGTVRAVALVMHGGRVTSQEPVAWHQPAVVRVRVLASALHRNVHRHGVQVWNLRFAVRGWNDAEQSPVADAHQALERLAGRVGAPIVLVGHSMGARTAVRVAGAPGVIGVVALAPWLPGSEPVAQLAGRSLALIHGSDDRVTDPRATDAFAARARGVAASVTQQTVPGAGHAMLRSAHRWDQLTAAAVLDIVAGAPGVHG